MPIAVTCGSCGARLKVADRLDGRTTACPRCQTLLLVRRPAPPKPAAAPPPRPAPLPPADDVEDLAASLLSDGDETSRAAGQKSAAALPEGVVQASREAERLVRLMLDCANKGNDRTMYLLTFDLLKEITRRAGDGSLNHQKANEMWHRYVNDGGNDSYLRNFLIVGAAMILPGSRLTLQESYDVFRKCLL